MGSDLTSPAEEFPSLRVRATQERLQDLAAAGVLGPAAVDEGIPAWRAALPWAAWADRLLLLLGTALVLSGIIFFFAYNWAAIPPLGRLALLETGLLLCAAAAWRTGLDSLPGQALVLASSVLVGVFLAVFGQAYQTGADAYELFRAWALLITPWVLAVPCGALWVLWLALWNVTLWLYWDQVVHPAHLLPDLYLPVFMALLDGLALVAREAATRRGLRWAAEPWLRGVLLVPLLLALTLPLCMVILDGRDREGIPALALLYAITLVTGAFWYYRASFDIASLSLLACSACVVFLTGTAKLVITRNEGTFFLFGLIVMGTVSFTAWALMRVALAHRSQGEGASSGP